MKYFSVSYHLQGNAAAVKLHLWDKNTNTITQADILNCYKYAIENTQLLLFKSHLCKMQNNVIMQR
jgi:hypothetical protein